MWKEFKRQWRLLFAFSAGERRGILLLSSLLLLGLIAYMLLPYFIRPDDQLLRQTRQLAEAWTEQSTDEPTAEKAAPDYDEEKNAPVLFPFDPNHMTAELGQRLGLKEKQVGNMLNYLKAGGSFKSKSDLKKIYSIRPEQYARLEPYILLPDSFSSSQKNYTAFPKAEYPKHHAAAFAPIDINAVDSVQLVSLKGIGPGFARRILKYRSSLGGFVSTAQLKEVWGLNDSLYQLLLPQIKLETAAKKISINEASAEELKAHPYIWKYQLARAIVNYREQHGPYHSADDLKKVLVLPDSTINRLVPYLSF